MGDNADAFPKNANESVDSDGDGVGDNADAFPNDAAETADTDGDGVGDNADAFPKDPDETADADGDGVGDNAQAAAEQKAMAKAGKELKKALGPTPLSKLGSTISDSLSPAGLSVRIAGTGDGGNGATPSPRMKPGASAGSVGGWAGTHYAHKNAGSGVSNSAIVYTNQAAPTVKPFATGASFKASQADFNAAYTATTRTLNLGSNFEGGTDIKSDMFPTAGTTNYTPTSPATDNIIRGTYQGAPGNFRCTGAIGCGATATTGGGVTLVGDWAFVHDTGAMTSRVDANYLYFGWWLQKDKDDEPTSASAFTGMVGDVDGNTMLADLRTLTGKATYTGGAAGKFAISDPLSGGDAGHFTADATLNATFGDGPTNGLSGTLDNFMANEKAVPWSVTLLRRIWSPVDGRTRDFDDPSTTTVNELKTQTVWSIDGNSAAASGTWDAMAFDEKPGGPPAGDGSNVPTSVTGTFQSHFGSTHSMVGAFGATKQ